MYRARDKDMVLSGGAVFREGEQIALAVSRAGKPASIVLLKTPSMDMIPIGQIETNARPQLVWCTDGKSIVRFDEPHVNEVRLSEDGKRMAFTRTAQVGAQLWSYDMDSTF